MPIGIGIRVLPQVSHMFENPTQFCQLTMFYLSNQYGINGVTVLRILNSKLKFFLEKSSVADPCHFGVDPDPDPDPRIHASDEWIRIRIRILDPDPAIFVIDLQDASKKLIFKYNFFCLFLFEAKSTSFF
jgi:hypothetical protein